MQGRSGETRRLANPVLHVKRSVGMELNATRPPESFNVGPLPHDFALGPEHIERACGGLAYIRGRRMHRLYKSTFPSPGFEGGRRFLSGRSWAKAVPHRRQSVGVETDAHPLHRSDLAENNDPQGNWLKSMGPMAVQAGGLSRYGGGPFGCHKPVLPPWTEKLPLPLPVGLIS